MKWHVIVIIILAFVIGFLIYKLNCKRRDNIIKVLIKRDLLPMPAEGTTWIEGSMCAMEDGSSGKVNGLYCQQIKVL